MVVTKRTRRGALYPARCAFTCSMTIASSASSADPSPGRARPRRRLLAEALVRDADHHGVGDAVGGLHHLLHLFGIDLLAAGVDADRAPSEQVDGAVRGAPRRSRRAPSSGLRRWCGRSPRSWPRPCSSRGGCARRGPAPRSGPSRASRRWPSASITRTSGPRVNWAVCAADAPPRRPRCPCRAPRRTRMRRRAACPGGGAAGPAWSPRSTSPPRRRSRRSAARDRQRPGCGVERGAGWAWRRRRPR